MPVTTHNIEVYEQPSLFPEYPSELSIVCSCKYTHVTTDKALHETALAAHGRQATIDASKSRHPCQLPHNENLRLGDVDAEKLERLKPFMRPWKDDGLGRD